ncbi:hypothetical protein [Caloranaerobacter ferrireducens]|uniref:hypothetical protein n=1 Tax=Caloranaerobacter ferrireducens TaxID=1323370 RepID=UPI00159F12C9|nr:hypothetical protein [Caloranaerobacter ferrireducens]
MNYQSKFNDIEKQLAELCTNFINMFDKMKINGIITEEEYIRHTKYKKDFLKKISAK